MASQFPPKKGTAFTLDFTLFKNDGSVIADPGTITKKISKDGGATADITAAITEIDTTYGHCSVVLSATEMTADRVWIYIKDDTSGCVPFTVTIYTAAQTLDELDAVADAVKAKTDGLNFAGPDVKATLDGEKVTVTSNEDKTGYALAADQPVNVTKIAGSAVNASSAQIGVNVVNWLGSTAVGMSGDAFAVVNNGTYGNAAIKTQLADIHDTDLPAVKADTAAILADTGTDGVVVAAASKSGYTLSPAGIQAIWDALSSTLATAGSIGKRIVDYLTGDIYARLGAPAGASVSADIAVIKSETATIVEDTAELQTDWANGGRLDVRLGAVLSDTDELQRDWEDGGRLDLLVDALVAEIPTGAVVRHYYPVTLSDGTPVGGALVEVTTDVAGTNKIRSTYTNSFGIATFQLNPGTYYFWTRKDGYSAANPDKEVVKADE